MANLKLILDQAREFPTLPTIYSALLDVMSNPRASVADVASIIAQDQASATKVLKAVNSSVYALQVRVHNISQAIFHLGFNEVKNLIIALSVINLFDKTKSLSAFNMLDLWKHSIAVGVATRLMGRQLGVKNIEDFFLSGILHDIGKLFFLRNFQDEYANVINCVEENDVTIFEAESRVLGITHTIAGDALAERWNLPASIRETIRYHHKGFIENKPDVHVCCIHIANIMVRALELGYPGDPFVPQPAQEIWKTLNLPPHTLVGLMNQILNDYQQSVQILLINK